MKKVDEYIKTHEKWGNEVTSLRQLLLEADLEEGFKWSRPIYMFNGKNVISLSAFKDYVGMWFFNGMFLKDAHNLLENAQDGKTVAMRHWRFQHVDEIRNQKHLIREYIQEAIQNQRQGKVYKPQKSDRPVPKSPLLQEELETNTNLKVAFNALSKSVRRDFAEYITEAKRQETKERRLQKIIPIILAGKSLHD